MDNVSEKREGECVVYLETDYVQSKSEEQCTFDVEDPDIRELNSEELCTLNVEDPVIPETWIKEEARAIHIPRESYVDSRLQSVVSIFRVPNFLKELNKKAYVPQIVSLGPYHSNRAKLSGMDKHKKRAMHRMMTRFNKKRHRTDSENMDFCFGAIHKIFQDEKKIRNNYEEKIDCKQERLAVMLTLDGCFILEILRTLGGNKVSQEGSDNYEPIFDRRKIDFTGFDMLNDILMLENQIPFIVLRKLVQLELVSDNETEKFLFDVLVKTPWNKFYPFDYKHDIIKASLALPDEQVPHLLALLHNLIVSPYSDDGDEGAADNNGKEKSGKDNRSNPTAVELSYSGIKFERRDDGDDGAADNNGKEKSGKDNRRNPTAVELSDSGIKFERGDGGIKKIYFDPKKATMYLPPIKVTDRTEVLFRNLIALELCKPSGMNYITCYLSFMSNLMGTEKDVALLRNRAIVKNYLGSDAEVAQLFHGLCKGVTVPREYVFQKLQDDVTDHCKDNLKVWFAQFMNEYFSPPWKVVAVAGAILALVLTLVQTIYAVLAYYK